MLARNTFAQADSAMNLVATAADVSLNFVSVLSYFKMDFVLHLSWILQEKKRKKKVIRKLNLKRRTSDRLRALTVRRRVYDGPGSDAKSPIVIDDDDDDDDASPIVIDDNDDGESYDPKLGSCMHALRSWNEISKSQTQ